MASSIGLLALLLALPLAAAQFKHRGGAGPRRAEPDLVAWSSAHGQVFPSREERALRARNYASTLATIAAHNARWEAGLEEWWMGVNQFSALSPAEFIARGTARAPTAEQAAARTRGHEARAAPARRAQTLGSVNWVTNGAVTAVQNQGQCGDCYSFSALGALTGAQAIASGCSSGTCAKLQDLSAQQICDCSIGTGNNDGCNGGYMDNVFQYIANQGGVCSAAAYPYAASNMVANPVPSAGPCQVPAAPATNNFCPVVAGVSSATPFVYTNIVARSGAQTPSLASFLSYLSQGPVSVGVYAGCTAFMNYAGGIFTATCQDASQPSSIDHAILATGFFSSGGIQYIQLKNQYGTGWGGTP